MSHSDNEAANVCDSADVAEKAIETVASDDAQPPLSATTDMRFEPSDLPENRDPPRPLGASEPKQNQIIEGRVLTAVTSDASQFAGPRRVERPAAKPRPPYGRMAAAAAAVLGLTYAGASLTRSGGEGVPTPAATAASVAASTTPAVQVAARPTETEREMAQVAVDMRLLSAKVETLRAEIERGRYVDDGRGLKRSVDALRSGFEQSKTETAATLAQMAQKLERLQREPNAKLAQIAERLDRIERRGAAAASDVTGSIARAASGAATMSAPKHAAPPQPVTAADVPKPPARPALASLPGPHAITPATGPDPRPQPRSEAKPPPRMIPGLRLRDVEGDVAIVEGHGQIFELASGDTIPGIGRVEGVERRGRELVLVTSRGLIGSRYRE